MNNNITEPYINQNVVLMVKPGGPPITSSQDTSEPWIWYFVHEVFSWRSSYKVGASPRHDFKLSLSDHFAIVFMYKAWALGSWNLKQANAARPCRDFSLINLRY